MINTIAAVVFTAAFIGNIAYNFNRFLVLREA